MGSHTNARRIFIVLILVALASVFALLLPFSDALIFAMVLAGTLAPLHKRLTKKLGDRENLSASLLSLGVLLLLLLPLGGLGAFVASEVYRGVKFITDTVQSEGMTALLERLPDSLRALTEHLIGTFAKNPQHLDEVLKTQAGAHSGKVAQFVSGALSATGNALLQGAMMLIGFYFLLVDGRAFVEWIEDNSPLKRGQVRELLEEFRQVSTSVLVSTIVTSAIQAVVALIGYALARVPSALFFGFITFFMAFVPAVGAGSVCIVAALLMLALGKTWTAIFLAVWGLVAVGLVDNWVKPILVKRGMQMHGGVIFFALFGGMTVFGAVGLVVGPLIVTFFLSLVRIYRRDFSSKDGTSAVTSPEA